MSKNLSRIIEEPHRIIKKSANLVFLLTIIPVFLSAQQICIPKGLLSGPIVIDATDGDWDPDTAYYSVDFGATNFVLKLAKDATYLYFYTEVTTSLGSPEDQTFFLGIGPASAPNMMFQIKPFNSGASPATFTPAVVPANKIIPNSGVSGLPGSTWTTWASGTEPPNTDFMCDLENSPERWILEGRITMAHMGISDPKNFDLFAHISVGGSGTDKKYWPAQTGFVDILTPSSLTFGENHCPTISVTPISYDFGAVRVGETSITNYNFTITNTGPSGSTLTYTLPDLASVTAFSYNGPAPSTQQTLASGASDAYTIQFTPNAEAPFSETITITSNDEDVDILLTGEGGLPHLVVAGVSGALPNITLDFEEVNINSPEVQSVNISNTGAVDLNITSIGPISGTGSSQFNRLAPSGNNITGIEAGDPAEPITLQFTPTSSGLKQASLVFLTNDPSYPSVTVNLRGTGVTREVVLLLDASGSMRQLDPLGNSLTSSQFNDSRWKELESAVSHFLVKLVEVAEGIGWFNGIYFGDPFNSGVYTAPVLPSLSTINATNRQSFENSLALVDYGNVGTPIGEALDVGVDHFSHSGSKRALILFSDGYWEGWGRDPKNFETNVKNSGARVYTLAYGKANQASVDVDLMREIGSWTEQTGEDNSFEVFSDNSFNIDNCFDQILSDELGLDLDIDPPGYIASGQQIARTIPVSGFNKQLIFHCYWDTYQENQLEFEILTPDCRLITPAVAASNSQINYYSNDKFKIYTLNSNWVTEGDYQVIIKGSDDLNGSEPYCYGLISQSGLKMQTVFDKSAYYTGNKIKVEVVLQGNGVPVTGATVYTTLNKPSESFDNWMAMNYVSKTQMAAVPKMLFAEPANAITQQAYAIEHILGVKPEFNYIDSRIFLYDDGVNGGDAIANDGVYTVTIENTNVAGTYDFHFHAEGLTPAGHNFSREARRQRDVSSWWYLPNIVLAYKFDFLPIDGRIRKVAVVEFYGEDPFGNVSISEKVIEGLKIEVANGKLWGEPINNGNGSFSQMIMLENPEKTPKINVNYRNQKVFKNYELEVPSGLTFVDKVIQYKPGKEGKKGFNKYSDPKNATGQPDLSSGSGKFVSLGGGGSITLAVKDKTIYNGSGPDLIVYEVAKSANISEIAESYSVEVQTKNGYVNLGTVKGGIGQFDLADKGITEASAVRILDVDGKIADHRGKLFRSPGADIGGVGIKYVKEGGGPGPGGEGKYGFALFAGWTIFDDTLGLNDGLVVGGKLGYRLINQLVLELEGGVTFTENIAGANGKVIQAMGNLRYELPVSGLWKPYATAGAGYVMFKGFGADDEAFAIQSGVGAILQLNNSFGLRAEGRMFRIGDVWNVGTTTNYQITGGFVYWF